MVTDHLSAKRGGKEFLRCRIGIDHPGTSNKLPYVLSKTLSDGSENYAGKYGDK